MENELENELENEMENELEDELENEFEIELEKNKSEAIIPNNYWCRKNYISYHLNQNNKIITLCQRINNIRQWKMYNKYLLNRFNNLNKANKSIKNKITDFNPFTKINNNTNNNIDIGGGVGSIDSSGTITNLGLKIFQSNISNIQNNKIYVADVNTNSSDIDILIKDNNNESKRQYSSKISGSSILNANQGWQPYSNDKNQYVQINLDKTKNIGGVIIKGNLRTNEKPELYVLVKKTNIENEFNSKVIETPMFVKDNFDYNSNINEDPLINNKHFLTFEGTAQHNYMEYNHEIWKGSIFRKHPLNIRKRIAGRWRNAFRLEHIDTGRSLSDNGSSTIGLSTTDNHIQLIDFTNNTTGYSYIFTPQHEISNNNYKVFTSESDGSGVNFSDMETGENTWYFNGTATQSANIHQQFSLKSVDPDKLYVIYNPLEEKYISNTYGNKNLELTSDRNNVSIFRKIHRQETLIETIIQNPIIIVVVF